MSVRLAVFASGSGTNLQALLDRLPTHDVVRVALVVSDRSDAGALTRAHNAGVPTLHIPVRERAHDDVARDTLAALERHAIDMIALGGYLRLIPAAVVQRYRNRILNIHPALLPSFGGKGMYGKRVHEAVLATGCTVTGVTVHRVDERYDEGGIIAQWPVPVLPNDTVDVLAARVLQIEHRLYPAVVEFVARRLGEAQASSAHVPGEVFRLSRELTEIEAELNAVTRG